MLAASSQGRDPFQRVVHTRRVQVGRRLVEDQQRGPRGQNVGDGEALLLASREGVGSAQLETGKTGLRQRFRHPYLHLGPWPAAIL